MDSGVRFHFKSLMFILIFCFHLCTLHAQLWMHGGEKISDLKPESFKTAKAIKLQITSSVIFIYKKKNPVHKSNGACRCLRSSNEASPSPIAVPHRQIICLTSGEFSQSPSLRLLIIFIHVYSLCFTCCQHPFRAHQSWICMQVRDNLLDMGWKQGPSAFPNILLKSREEPLSQSVIHKHADR